jgi:hypothetical protein
MKSQRIQIKAALVLAGLIWLCILTQAPTLDFDESLYRSVASAMKKAGDPWLLRWDGNPLYHKPPLFYWLLCASSALLDSGKEIISSFAARIPSLFASAGILLSLYFACKKRIAPVLAFTCALFPMITAPGVIFDPLQTLALMPSLFIPTRAFDEEREPRILEYLFIALSLALASMVKGLNGLVIPAFAFGFHLLLHWRHWGIQTIFQIGLRFLALSILPAGLITAGFYMLLNHKIGPEFTQEFIWVQHFSRSNQAMEAHSGSLLYHPLVIFLGGGFLIPYLIHQGHRVRPHFLKQGFPLSFVFSFLLFFGFSATKLPHYTWPAWAALALFAGNLEHQDRDQIKPRILERRLSFLAGTPVFLLGVLMLLLALRPSALTESLPQSEMLQSFIAHYLPFTLFQKTCFYFSALCCFLFQTRRRTSAYDLKQTALFAGATYLTLILGVLPTVRASMITPFEEIAVSLKSKARSSDCIRYNGPLSATLSLYLAPELIHNRCDPNQTRYLITPEWKTRECADRNLETRTHHGHLVLCEPKAN